MAACGANSWFECRMHKLGHAGDRASDYIALLAAKVRVRIVRSRVLAQVCCGFALVAGLSGCVGLHDGYATNSVSLQRANFSVVASDVYGTASAFYLLGIGGMLADSLISEAKENLKHRRPLKVGQVCARERGRQLQIPREWPFQPPERASRDSNKSRKELGQRSP